LEFPEQRAAPLVISMEAFIHCRANKHQPPRGDERSADVESASRRESFLFKSRVCSQRDLPADFALVEVDRVQCAPRTFVDWKSIRIPKFVVARGNIRNLVGKTEFRVSQ